LTEPKSHRFLIVDDHPVTRAGTRSLLESHFRGCRCREADSLFELRRLLALESWDLVVLDHHLPDGAGIDFLRETPHKPPTLVLTVCDDRGIRMDALRAGAKGFASKSDPPERILATVDTLLSGGSVFDPHLPCPCVADKPLSEREEEVLRAILDGKRLVEIAILLGIQPTSVQSYKKRLLEKFGVSNIPELVKEALRRGFR